MSNIDKDIERLFADRVRDVRTPVPDHLWEELSEVIPPEEEKRPFTWIPWLLFGLGMLIMVASNVLRTGSDDNLSAGLEQPVQETVVTNESITRGNTTEDQPEQVNATTPLPSSSGSTENQPINNIQRGSIAEANNANGSTGKFVSTTTPPTVNAPTSAPSNGVVASSFPPEKPPVPSVSNAPPGNASNAGMSVADDSSNDRISIALMPLLPVAGIPIYGPTSKWIAIRPAPDAPVSSVQMTAQAALSGQDAGSVSSNLDNANSTDAAPPTQEEVTNQPTDPSAAQPDNAPTHLTGGTTSTQ